MNVPHRATQAWRAFAGINDSQLIPQARLSGPMPWVIAIMVALTVIAAAGGLTLRNAAAATSLELAGGITVQIVEARPEERARQAAAVLARLREAPGVTAARLVPPEKLHALIEPWLGAGPGLNVAETIPVPALIDAQLAGTINSARMQRLQQHLREVAPAARVDAQAGWLKPVFDAIQSLQFLALGLIVLLASAMAATVLLATRNALGTNRDTIEVVHFLGGTDAQIARIFQRSIGLDAAGGSLVGIVFAGAVILFLGQQFAAMGAGMIDGGTFGWIDWTVLALVPVAAILLAMLTARLSVMHALRKIL